ncbi:MAG TPA: RIP metalloprotease RseP [Nitrosomonas nitrosa]|jgi:regulator of sigma E protease|uniref:Zinc metalloprotease n=1 Tax=Nitrosomonas nitrosa TaxID=52442 RepID=A0A1I4P7N0_9PROT|nr:RIP metalloprotease RseP [Nitrosomonas nitrosa]MCO6434556.1 RIP metalloprotease RseP [Nitrosomonas nitrosa]PTQ97107.1 regulator of sigma E protease [Nitrosomonas nitrosa]CAE6509902.1 zinc metallopeptidase [Nitrosomonas nitrosa]SFM23709.1 regulator of sigma E protease [Nitrosomonas nitrosa]HBZ31352.1 RIP metalloprotease RseP [Nitrosomonas nitrosa]
MSILFTILAFIVALGVLITFHEFGHYLVARWCGVKVLRFSIGFGQPLFKKNLGKDQTEWVVAALPLGGYVKMLDEREEEVPPEDLARAFNRQSVSKRFAIVAAGPLANFLLAILLYWLLFISGVSGIKPMLGPIKPSTPAAMAAFQEGETIVKIENEPVATWQDARWVLLSHAVDRNPEVMVETINERGEIFWRKMNLSDMHADDLDAHFLEKIGLAVYQPFMSPVVGQVMAGSAGERAGLMAGDEILSIDHKEIERWEELVTIIRAHPGQPLILEILRNGNIMEIPITPDSANEGNSEIGRIGIAPKIDHEVLNKLHVNVTYPPGAALLKAFDKTWEMTIFTFRMLGKMVMGEVSLKNVSGPITIADYAGQSAQMGIIAYLSFLALISISLAVLNLLPIPVLDGGHLMYYVIEIIKGSPLSEKTMAIGQQIGIAMLFTLMVFAIYNDIYRLISG